MAMSFRTWLVVLSFLASGVTVDPVEDRSLTDPQLVSNISSCHPTMVASDRAVYDVLRETTHTFLRCASHLPWWGYWSFSVNPCLSVTDTSDATRTNTVADCDLSVRLTRSSCLSNRFCVVTTQLGTGGFSPQHKIGVSNVLGSSNSFQVREMIVSLGSVFVVHNVSWWDLAVKRLPHQAVNSEHTTVAMLRQAYVQVASDRRLFHDMASFGACDRVITSYSAKVTHRVEAFVAAYWFPDLVHGLRLL